MRFEDTLEEAAWRDEVRGFISKELPEEFRKRSRLSNAPFAGNETGNAAAGRPTAQAGGTGFRLQGGAMGEWREKLASKGWVAPAWPKEYGGAGLGTMEQFILNEEFAEAGAPQVGGMGVSMAGPTIIAHGTDEQKAEHLPKILKGEVQWCQGFSEPGSGSDLASLQTRAVRDGDDYVINGSKIFITNGARADFGILVTKTDPDARHDGITLFAVDLRDSDGNPVPGFSVSRTLEKMGMHASDTAELAFEDMRVPADAVLGEIGKGFYHISWELQGERLVAAAGCYAGAERMFERTLEYAKEREAFGRPIGKFQVIRHKFAEMATKIEAAKQMVHATAWRFANGEYPVREITMAKLNASRVCHEVADECVQIHGGYGYMKEYEIERAYRDQRLNRIGAGTDEIMLDVIGRSYGL